MPGKFDVFKYILSDENIFNAVYSVESYISEKNLLSVEDAMLLQRLRDKYNSKLILNFIKECRINIYKYKGTGTIKRFLTNYK